MVTLQEKERYTCAFLPSEVRELFELCKSEDNLSHLMYWTMVIVGIKQFLTVKELYSIKVEDFVTELFEVSGNQIQALAFRVKGKRGFKSPVRLMMWDDTEHHDMSPTRALMLWLHVSKITTGPIFPTELMNLPTFQQIIAKNRSSDIGEEEIFGTKSLLKTSYLFAICGSYSSDGAYLFPVPHKSVPRQIGGPNNSVSMSGRHKPGSVDLRTYVSDSVTIMEWIRKIPTESRRQHVSTWKSIYVPPDYNVSVQESNRLSIVQLSEHYMTQALKMMRKKPTSIKGMMEAAMRMTEEEHMKCTVQQIDLHKKKFGSSTTLNYFSEIVYSDESATKPTSKKRLAEQQSSTTLIDESVAKKRS